MKHRPTLLPEAAYPGMKPAHQRRSVATRNRILDAIEKALKEDRLESLTVQDIVREAKCSIGAFYGRFADKDAALAALFAARREIFGERILRLTLLNPGVEEWAERCGELALDHALANRPLLARAAVQSASSSQILSDAHDANTELAGAISNLVANKWLPAISKEQAKSITAFVFMMIGAMTRDTVTYFPNVLEAKSQRRWFCDQLTLAVCGYVRVNELTSKT